MPIGLKLKLGKTLDNNVIIFFSEDAEFYERDVQEAEKRLIKMKQHQADLFSKVELRRRDIDKQQQNQQNKQVRT